MSLKTYLNSLVRYDDLKLNLPGYKLARDDNLRNNKRAKVGIYSKEIFAVWPVPINSLKEGLLQEIFIVNEKDLYHHYIDHQSISRRALWFLTFTRSAPVKHD